MHTLCACALCVHILCILRRSAQRIMSIYVNTRCVYTLICYVAVELPFLHTKRTIRKKRENPVNIIQNGVLRMEMYI